MLSQRTLGEAVVLDDPVQPGVEYIEYEVPIVSKVLADAAQGLFLVFGRQQMDEGAIGDRYELEAAHVALCKLNVALHAIA